MSAPVRRAALVFIFITVLLDVLALGMIIPVFPRLILGFVGNDTGRAAEMVGLFTTLFAAMQFLFSPLVGAASDRLGRRPVVLMSNFGLGLDYIVVALAPSLSWLFAGRVISGITAASIPTAFAYIADVTPPEKRAQSFGLLGAAFGVGFVLGPALGGLVGQIDPRFPFWLAAALSLSNAVYGMLVLPESLAKEHRAPKLDWRRANPVGSLGLLRSNAQLLGLAGVGLVANLAHVVLPSVFVLYADYRYGWGERAVGLTLGGVGICSMIVQAGLIQPVIARLGEKRTLLFGLCMGAIGMTIYGLAKTPLVFCLGIPVMALWGLSGPAIQGLMSRRVSPSEQGRLQGANQSLMAIAELVGPFMFAGSFAYFIAKERAVTFPGAPFLLSALLLLASAVLCAFVTREERAQPPAPTISPDVEPTAG